MFLRKLSRSKAASWLLVPVVAGLILTTGAPVTRAYAALPTSIVTPGDAKQFGLDSLGNLMRSGNYNSGANVKPLVLPVNNGFKVPLPANLDDFVKDRQAALQLGKALFWDMQVGSDGIQACASCHFQAGGDVRTKNQVATQGGQVFFDRGDDVTGFFFAQLTKSDTFENLGDGQNWATNDPQGYQLVPKDFPLVLEPNAMDPAYDDLVSGDIVKADTSAKNRNDVVGSMGVMPAQFGGVEPGKPLDLIKPGTTEGTKRPTTGRNAPPSVQAVFNYLQFWDGRADSWFNGSNPIGRHANPTPKYYVNNNNKLQARVLDMKLASLASQATGPPLSDVEMSYGGRTWPEIGKKLTRGGAMVPLAYQKVSTSDSVLGTLAKADFGLNTTYKAMVEAAFQNHLWDNTTVQVSFTQSKLVRTHKDELIFMPGEPTFTTASTTTSSGKGGKGKNPGGGQPPSGYTQMEANFSMFWGIAVMLYEAELVSPQSKFDQWMEGDSSALTEEELAGLNVFVFDGKCIACHGGPEFTNASVKTTQAGRENIEPIIGKDGNPKFYTNGFYNVGNTPTVDDITHGGPDPFGKPWGSARQFLFKYNNIMNIPFPIDGLPIKNLTSRQVVDNGEIKTGLFKVDQAAGTDFLVCYDLDGDGMCGLNDDIVIQALDQDGNCKASHLRNVELNGPYFRGGTAATLQQVVRNYDEGGLFNRELLNEVDMLPDVTSLGLGANVPGKSFTKEHALVSFLLALTDNRVKTEAAPFDHPELFLPKVGNAPKLNVLAGPGPAAWNAWLVAQSAFFEQDQATGAGGLAPLPSFIDILSGGAYDNFDEDTGK